MTGWTLYADMGLGKELLLGNQEAIKLFSMRENLQVFCLIKTHVIDYSWLSYITLGCFFMPITYVKMSIARRQSAWVDNKHYSTHQRLNKEYLKNNKDIFEQYSTNLSSKELKGKEKLHPNYVTGFSDGESTFSIRIVKRSTNKIGWHIQPIFKIELHLKDALILKSIQSFFGVGSFRIQNTNGRNAVAIYSVESIKDMINVIIPHFDKYPLITQKRADYELLKKIVIMMNNKEHLTMEGLNKIVSIRASLNKGLSPLLSKHFLDVVPHERPKVEILKTFDPFWFLGFVEGEGCFYVKIANIATDKYIISLKFILSQHSRDRLLLNSLIQYLGYGKLEETPIIARLVITKIEDIQKVLSFFVKYPLIGIKKHDFSDWCKVAELMKNKIHLTPSGINEIKLIKAKMNSGRDFFDISNSADIGSSYSNSNSEDSDSSEDISTESDIGRKLQKVDQKTPKTQWELKLVGLTDSDEFDSFNVKKIKGEFVLKYSISQPFYNIRLLYYIKKTLGNGKVLKFETQQLSSFIINDRKVLKEIIFPIFDKYSLLTRKYFSYLQFKKAWSILENNNFTTEQKNEAIENLLNNSLSNNYVSPAISHLNDKSSYETIKSAISIYWLAGFIEGKGNFGVLYEQSVFIVEFSIRIKREEALLYFIKRFLHIPNKVILEQNGFLLLKTKQSRAISNIIDAFSSKDCKFKSMKSLYFKLWKKAFYYKNINIKKVAIIYKIMLNLHKKHTISR